MLMVVAEVEAGDQRQQRAELIGSRIVMVSERLLGVAVGQVGADIE